MLKVKDFVFALLTLICVSPAVGEEQVYPEAKEWPKFEGFEWGMSEDEFYEACAKKKLKKIRLDVTGKLLGENVIIGPYFGEWDKPVKDVGLLNLYFTFRLQNEDSKEFSAKLLKILEGKYGRSKCMVRTGKPQIRRYSWGSPDMPHIRCLIMAVGVASDKGNFKDGVYEANYSQTHTSVSLNYVSKSLAKHYDKHQKKRAAEQRELEKNAKEDEKDF